MGNLLAVKVHAANIHDTKAGIEPAKEAVKKYPTIKGFLADAGYRKTFVVLVAAILGLFVNISERIKPDFEILPKRWVVERTLAWVNHSRRLSKDYEIKTIYAENMFMISHLHILLRRY
jgi:transposase